MNTTNGGAEPRLVIPGEPLDGCAGKNPGSGVAKVDDGLIATRLGHLRETNGTMHVQPINATYLPRSGDLVIGYVEAVQSNLWFLDVAGPFNALLPMSLAPWKVEFGDARTQMDVGEAVLARVQEVDETHSVVCTMKGVGLRKISSGHVTDIPVQLVESLKSVISDLKTGSECRIILSDNGRLWIDGDAEGIRQVLDTVEVITSSGHISGLSERIEATLAGGVA